jgi:hypothetical protein
MNADWYYLDPLHQQRGPLTDAQLEQVLQRIDCRVWRAGMPGWEWASEYFARNDTAALKVAAGTPVDAHGQPNPRLNAARRMQRGMEEIFGLIRGIMCDGVVTQREVLALGNWLRANEDIIDQWPANVLIDRLQLIFTDGRLTEDELQDFGELLRLVAGDAPIPGKIGSSRLPIDYPEPPIHFEDRVFVFTGEFARRRADCEREVIRRGGRPEKNVTKRSDYVVIGGLASRDWKHSALGTKIAKAMDYRAAGGSPSIISEEHWEAAVRSPHPE